MKVNAGSGRVLQLCLLDEMHDKMHRIDTTSWLLVVHEAFEHVQKCSPLLAGVYASNVFP